MRIKGFLVFIIIMIFASGCESEINNNERKQMNNDTNTNKAVRKIDDRAAVKEYNPEQKEVTENKPKEYIGKANDNAIVSVYMKKDLKSKVIHKLQNHEEVRLLETLPYGWFKVVLEDGRQGYVDARKVTTDEIPPHEYNEKRKGYTLIFNHNNQRLKIYNDGELMLESVASSGLDSMHTPRGIFVVEKGRRGEWEYVPAFNSGFKYWVGFKGAFLFHSIPMNKSKRIIDAEAKKLGSPASHGCIRLPVNVAKYIYDNVPEGALVLIY